MAPTTTTTTTKTTSTTTAGTSSPSQAVPITKVEETQLTAKPPTRASSPRPPTRIKTTWVSFLTKRELEAYLRELGMDDVGTVEELRRRLSTYVNGGYYSAEVLQRLQQLEHRHSAGGTTRAGTSDTPTTDIPDELPDVTPPISDRDDRNPHDTQERANPGIRVDDRTFDRVRSWTLRFDGRTSPIDFIDRVEELANSQRIPLAQIPFTLSESFEGSALAWWRNRRHEWLGWPGFKRAFLKYFLPVNFWDDLEDAVRQRQQKEGEPFQEYALALETLMRHTQCTPLQKLDRIYRNSVPALRLLVKRSEFTTLEELTDLVLHIEATRGPANQSGTPTVGEVLWNLQPRSNQRERADSRSTPQRFERSTPRPIPHQPPRANPGPMANAATPSFIPDHRNACRRCTRLGHTSQGCKNPQVLFCWKCGKMGIRTIECCRADNTNLRTVGDRTLGVNATEHNSRIRLKVGTPWYNGRSLLASVASDDHSWQGILDTGSWHSFVNSRIATQLYTTTDEPTTCRYRVVMANGQQQNITKLIRATLEVGNHQHDVNLLVLPDSADPFILGMDVLAALSTTIQVGDTTLQITNVAQETRLAVVENDTPQADPQTQSFLEEELNLFRAITGVCNRGTHKIIMRDDRPIKQRYHPRNPVQQAIIDEKVNELLEKGCIEPSSSPHSAPVVLVRKKNNQWRMCVDYRQLNAKSIPDAYPLPRIHHILDRLRNAKVISSLDLKDGYWQIPMDPESRQYTAFTVPGRGLFQWKVMPFGLHSAPATFQRTLDSIIGTDLEPHVFAYLDDIIIHSTSEEEHRHILREVFHRLRTANLRINAEKCEFFRRKVRYLGHVISEHGIQTDPEKVSAIKALTPPTNIRELRRCLGIASWYRRFVPEFSNISRPMTNLLKKGKHFKWGDAQQRAFDVLKQRLTEAPVLACPDFTVTFKLQTDASDLGLGAVLTQDIDGQERVIAYASRHLNMAEKNYSATEKECLAIIWGVRKMREYLEGYRFIVVTDHLALKWLNSIESPSGRIARWALELQQYQYEVQYRRGKLNVLADALSRQPEATIRRIDKHTQGPQWPASKMAEVLEKPQAFPEYVIENGRLYRHFPNTTYDEDATPWKLCVDHTERERVLKEAHDQPTAGHQGIRKTNVRVMNRYYWPGMFRDISQYVRGCQQCQRYKVSQQAPAGHMLSHIPEEPWATVCMDFVGPLPRSKHGNTTLLVTQDKFTKWVELAPMRSATSEGAIKAFRQQILAHFGVPKMLITDNGTQFTSRRFQKTLADLGIQHRLTAPYTPQENAVERANRVVKTMLAQYCEENQRTWDELIPEITLALNTGVSESTGQSPAYLVQGREPRLPNALFDEVTPGTGRTPETGREMADRLHDTFGLVRQQLRQASQNQARYYNLRRRDWRPQMGQLVWVRDHPLSKGNEGFAAKLAPKYEGPFQVISFKSPVIVNLTTRTNGNTRTAHVRDLKPYHSVRN